jgi:hypothetical protein
MLGTTEWLYNLWPFERYSAPQSSLVNIVCAVCLQHSELRYIFRSVNKNPPEFFIRKCKVSYYVVFSCTFSGLHKRVDLSFEINELSRLCYWKQEGKRYEIVYLRSCVSDDCFTDDVPTLVTRGCFPCLNSALIIATIGTKVWDVELCSVSGGEFLNELITLLVTS